MDAFASAADLGKRLKRTFTSDEVEWIDELLADASAYLRDVIGQQVFPRTQTTYTAYPSGGREDLPVVPLVSVDAVTRNGDPIDFTYRPGHILVDCDTPCDVTVTHGYLTPPRELTRLACVLVSQTLLPLEAQLGLAVGGLSSAQLDDFRLSWADGGDKSGMFLTEHTEARIRTTYGLGDVHVGETAG